MGAVLRDVFRREGDRMSVTFTKGPWMVAPHPDDAEMVEIVTEYSERPDGGKQAHWIAECDAGVDTTMSDDEQLAAIDENIANARLIATAPELREALMDLVAIIDKAGLLNLSNGVQLGATSWYVKASDRLKYARTILTKAHQDETEATA
jgi:hypothetical protein